MRVERRGPVATIWIDRQAKMNTMTVAMRNEFPGIFQGLDADRASAPAATSRSSSRSRPRTSSCGATR
jgi:enoyl-CoA hydratase/carnithine racemase